MPVIVKNQGIKEMAEKVADMLRTVYDPEIPVDIFELGLIYEILVDESNNIKIIMTLTSPSCPAAEVIPQEIKEKVESIEETEKVEVEVTFDPPWEQDMMSEAARLELGFM